MTHVMLAWLGPDETGLDFRLALANALGLNGIRADAGLGKGPSIWLGLLPQPNTADGNAWSIQTWAPASVGPSFHLAAELHAGLLTWATAGKSGRPRLAAGDGGVAAQLPPEAAAALPPIPMTGPQAIVTLPPSDADSLPEHAARGLAQAMAALIARHLGVVNQVTMSIPFVTAANTQLEPGSSISAVTPVHQPDPASREVTDVPSVSSEGRKRNTQSRSGRQREGRQGSRTYEHRPWATTESVRQSAISQASSPTGEMT